MNKGLIGQIKLVEFKAGTTGATCASGVIFDTEGYEGALFIGLIESTAVTAKLVAQGGTATNDMSQYTGPTGGEASGKFNQLYLQVHRPKKRYIQGQIFTSAGGQNSMLVSILYGPRALPTVQDSASWNGLTLYSPNSGTASTSGS